MKSIQLFIIEVWTISAKLAKFYRDRSYFEMWFIEVRCRWFVRVCVCVNGSNRIKMNQRMWTNPCDCEQLLLNVVGWDLHIIFATQTHTHTSTKEKTIDGWRFYVRISMQSLAANLKHHLTLNSINNAIVLDANETKTFGSDFMYNVYVYQKIFSIQLRFQLWKLF